MSDKLNLKYLEVNEEKSVEEMIQEKDLNYPRLTPDYIEDVASRSTIDYHIFPGTQLTVCCMTLPNGYNVTGESACVSPQNFDEEIGRKVAFNEAKRKIWELEGYLLKERMMAHRSPDEVSGD